MKKICSLLVAITLIFAFTSCTSKGEVQNGYFGKWKASDKIYFAPIYAMSAEDYKERFYGKEAVFSEDEASFAGETIQNPTYTEAVIGKQDFLVDYRIQLSDLGINENKVKIIEIQNWTNPGSLLIIKDKNTLITLWDGVFFELERE